MLGTLRNFGARRTRLQPAAPPASRGTSAQRKANSQRLCLHKFQPSSQSNVQMPAAKTGSQLILWWFKNACFPSSPICSRSRVRGQSPGCSHCCFILHVACQDHKGRKRITRDPVALNQTTKGSSRQVSWHRYQEIQQPSVVINPLLLLNSDTHLVLIARREERKIKEKKSGKLLQIMLCCNIKNISISTKNSILVY